jgi:hemolysin activation/secretion protein
MAYLSRRVLLRQPGSKGNNATSLSPSPAPVFWMTALGSQLVWFGAPARSQPVLVPVNPGLQQQQGLQQGLQQRRQQGQPVLQWQEAPPVITRPDKTTTSDKPGDGRELLIQRVEVLGARSISVTRIREVFAPLLSTGQQSNPVRFSQLQAAIEKATNLYRHAGYFTSRVVVGQGALKDGVLTVVVVEGFLEEVEVSGRGSDVFKLWARGYLQRLVSSAEQPRPIRLRELERQLLLMQSFGGVRFKTTLMKGTSFGGSKLVLELMPQYVSGSISLDNNVQPQLGDVQVAGLVQINVLNDAPQPLQLNAFVNNAFPYPGGLATGVVSFTTPIGNQGLRLVGIGSFTSTNSVVTPLNVGGAPLGFKTAGQSWLGLLSLRYPLLLSRTASLNVSLSGEFQNSTNSAYLDGMLAYVNPTRLRVLRLGIDGSLNTPFYASNASLQISQGLPIAGAFDRGTFVQIRGSMSDGSVGYTSARLNLRHQQRIGASNTFLTVSGNGQVTSSILPAPEDFSYGGQVFGRAYRGTYLSADQGASASLELSHSLNSGSWTTAPFVFADYGVASNNNGVLTPPNYYAASYGIGLKANWSTMTSWEVGWAIPTGAYPEATKRSGPANSIVYFRFNLAF